MTTADEALAKMKALLDDEKPAGGCLRITTGGFYHRIRFGECSPDCAAFNDCKFCAKSVTPADVDVS